MNFYGKIVFSIFTLLYLVMFIITNEENNKKFISFLIWLVLFSALLSNWGI